MPAINRQTPPKKAMVEIPTDSVLVSAIPTTQLIEQYVTLCIYGRNRSGKTTLAAQFDKPMLVISSEPDENGGAMSISDQEGILITRISPANKPIPGDKVKGSAKVVAIANELAVRNPFKTVVLDTITSLQDVILVELMGLSKMPEVLSWGLVSEGIYQQRAEKLRETVRPLLNLKTCNVVVLAQEKDHNAPEERGGKSKILHTMQQGSFMAPALGATNAQWLQDNCGYILQLYEDEILEDVTIPMNHPDGTPAPPVVQKVPTGKRARHLRLLYHPNFAAGGRWRYNENIPEYVTAKQPKALYEAMAQYIPTLAR